MCWTWIEKIIKNLQTCPKLDALPVSCPQQVGPSKYHNAHVLFQALLLSEKVDPNLRGEKGMRALHYCAYKDRDECATMLVRFVAFVFYLKQIWFIVCK